MRCVKENFPTLATLATGFFEQLRILGQFCQGTESTQQKAIIELASRRERILYDFYSLLEEVGGLEFDEKEQVLAYNRAYWAGDNPIAGYSRTDEKILPSAMLSTYTGNWRLDLSKQDEGCTARLLKCALFVRSQSNFHTAFNYLLDCSSQGLTLKRESVFRALCLLAGLESIFSDDKHPLKRIFGKQPNYPSEWMDAEFVIDRSGIHISSSILKAVIQTLIDRCLRTIDKTKNSESYGAWLRLQSALYVLISALFEFCELFKYSPKQSLDTLFSQFEEIRCDAGGVIELACRQRNKALLGKFGFVNARVLLNAFSAQFGRDEGIERAFNERALIPHALKEHFLNDSSLESLPDEWSKVKPLDAWPLFTAIYDNSAEGVLFVFSEVAKEQAPSNTGAEIIKIINSLIKQGEFGHAVTIKDKLLRLAQDYPYNSYVKRELAICLDRCNSIDEALPVLELSLLLNIEDKEAWRSLGVVLSRKGRKREGKVAYEFFRMLADSVHFSKPNSTIGNPVSICFERIDKIVTDAIVVRFGIVPNLTTSWGLQELEWCRLFWQNRNALVRKLAIRTVQAQRNLSDRELLIMADDVLKEGLDVLTSRTSINQSERDTEFRRWLTQSN